MAKSTKVGVVGCGYRGPNLIRNFRSLPDCSLKMMCDASESRLTHLKPKQLITHHFMLADILKAYDTFGNAVAETRLESHPDEHLGRRLPVRRGS